MADRYSERAGQRWEDSERRFRTRDREYGDADRGFLERFADEMRSWFGNEEAQRRRIADEREDWRGERGGGDWGGRERTRGDWGQQDAPRSDWSRGDWSRGDWGRGESTRGPDDRRWSRDWGYVEGRGRDYGAGDYASGGYGRGAYGTTGYGSGSYGNLGQGTSPFGSSSGYGGYGAWGRERDSGRQGRETGGDWTQSTGPHSGRGPRNYQRSDERIKEDLCERLTQHSYLDPSEIEVRVQNGEITLEGSVSDRWAKRTAEDLAEGISGVREVHNQLRVVQSELGQEPREGRDEPGRSGPQRGTWAA
jgi:hypothetical protein